MIGNSEINNNNNNITIKEIESSLNSVKNYLLSQCNESIIAQYHNIFQLTDEPISYKLFVESVKKSINRPVNSFVTPNSKIKANKQSDRKVDRTIDRKIERSVTKTVDRKIDRGISNNISRYTNNKVVSQTPIVKERVPTTPRTLTSYTPRSTSTNRSINTPSSSLRSTSQSSERSIKKSANNVKIVDSAMDRRAKLIAKSMDQRNQVVSNTNKTTNNLLNSTSKQKRSEVTTLSRSTNESTNQTNIFAFVNLSSSDTTTITKIDNKVESKVDNTQLINQSTKQSDLTNRRSSIKKISPKRIATNPFIKIIK